MASASVRKHRGKQGASFGPCFGQRGKRASHPGDLWLAGVAGHSALRAGDLRMRCRR